MAADKPGKRRFALPRIGDTLADTATRKPGPMAVAGRQTGETLARVSEEQAEQRRRNADDAEALRRADADGLLLRKLKAGEIDLTSLPRDRMNLSAVAASDEMAELKASIAANGQREPVEVWKNASGGYSLKSGWRRIEALRQLRVETGDPQFDFVTARVTGEAADKSGHYLAMVEENAIRVNVSFAEMANVAIEMANDPESGVDSDEDAVARLYGNLHKVKRSNIRRFVDLLRMFGDVLTDAQDIPKNIGAAVARAASADPEFRKALAGKLANADGAAAQMKLMNEALRAETAKPVPKEKPADKKGRATQQIRKQEIEVVADSEEIRIRHSGRLDLEDKARFEAAFLAFCRALSS